MAMTQENRQNKTSFEHSLISKCFHNTDQVMGALRVTCRKRLRDYLATLLFIITCCSGAYAQNTQVLIIHSYSQEYPWTQGQHAAFIDHYERFAPDFSTIRTEYLDTKRIPYTEEYGAFFTSYLAKKYHDFHPRLIYVTDDDALTFAHQHLTTLFPNAKIIFSGVNNYEILNRLDKTRFTGVFERKDIAQNLDLIKSHAPFFSDIIVVGDGSSTFLAIQQKLDSALKQFPNVNVSYAVSNNIDVLIKDLRTRKEKYLFLTTIGSITNNQGKSLTIKEIVKGIVNAGNFMILSMEDAYVTDGVVGGYVTSSVDQGRLAAEMSTAYVYKNTDFLEIPPITRSPNRYLFDHNALSKHNIVLSKEILAEATILNQPQSLYDQHKALVMTSLVILTVLLLVTMAIFIAFLVRTGRATRIANLTSQEQAHKLFLMHQNLVEAQSIAKLGNWEWHIDKNVCMWSDELYRLLGLKPNAFPASYEKLLSFIPTDAKAIVDRAIQDSLKFCCEFNVDHPVITDNGKTRYVRQSGKVCFDIKDRSLRVSAILLDITTTKHYENAEQERARRIERYQDALLDCSNAKHATVEEALHSAAEVASCTLETDQTSIWLFNEDKSALTCRYAYSPTSQIKQAPAALQTKDFPTYISALSHPNPIAITHARADNRTAELVDTYLIPNNIYSILDVPIFYDGDVAGVVCHEVIGKERVWAPHEIEFSQAISNIVALSLEIDKRKAIENELAHLAYHDVLTKLPNRSLFHDRLEQALRLADRTKTLAAILFLDLDNFKDINDSLGHEAGDQVLVKIARRLQNRLRDIDTVCRLGGDEFSMILGGFKNVKHVRDVVLKIYSDFQIPLDIQNQSLSVSSSIGISVFPDDGTTPEVLLRNADSAMYRAKEEGRNSFHFYTKDMTEQAFERVLLESELRNALTNSDFEIFYQPQYYLTDDTLSGLEALVRWQHPRLGLVYPDKFLPLMTEIGLAFKLDRLIISGALNQLSAWAQQGLQPGTLSLNLSANHIFCDDFCDYLSNAIQQAGCRPSSIILEISELNLMTYPEKTTNALKAIAKTGVALAIDDFGTGHSCIPYLTKLPISRIVIDKSFVCNATENTDDINTIHGMIGMAERMNIEILAEGIEKEQQRQLLKNTSCRYAQGFLYGRPMPKQEIERLLPTSSQTDVKLA